MTRTVFAMCLGLALLAAPGLGQRQVTQRFPQFDNERVRVWRTVIYPGQPESMHRHDHARTVVALKGGTLKVVNQAGESHSVTWETGKAYWLTADPPGELHGDINEGTEPIEVMIVEMQDDR